MGVVDGEQEAVLLPQRQLVETEKGPGATAEGYVAWWPKSFEIEYGPLPHYVPPPPKPRDQSDGAGSSGRGNKRARRSEEEGDQRVADATPRDAQGKGNSEGSDTAKGKGKGGQAQLGKGVNAVSKRPSFTGCSICGGQHYARGCPKKHSQPGAASLEPCPARAVTAWCTPRMGS